MTIAITGGAGFLGLRLARKLLRDGLNGQPIDRLILADRASVELDDPRVEWVVGDICDPAIIERAIPDEVSIVYHLAAVVSGQAEADFDLGLRVNVDAFRAVLEACRRNGNRPRLIFTSSVAVYGPSADAPVDDRTVLAPRSSYGMEKAVGELLLSDYSRRGYIDGVGLRLPTISVRPGVPNQAASSFASGIVREPLTGQDARCPVAPETELWLLSPRRTIEALAYAATMDSEALGTQRMLNLPGVSVTVAQMVESLRRVGGDAAVARLRWERDTAVENIVASWPRAWDDARARGMGFDADASFDAIVDAFVEDELNPIPA